MVTIALSIHIAAGFVALATGFVALSTRKGGRVHRAAGRVFVVAMAVMASLAIYLAVALPDELPNVFIGSFVLYLIGTGWATVRRADGVTSAADKAGLAFALVLFAPFAVLSFQLATGMAPFLRSQVPLEGPVAIAIYSFTGLLALAVIGDVRTVRRGVSGRRRIARHLWRMCLGLTLATGSAFTNGFARMLPGPYHVPVSFHLPKLVPLGFLLYHLVRVRYTRAGRTESLAVSRPG